MAAPVRVAVSGATGRMGRSVTRLAGRTSGIELAGGVAGRAGVDRGGEADHEELVALPDAGALLEAADVVIDFSAPSFLRSLLETHGGVLRGTPLVVGTTGLGAAEQRLLEEHSAHAPLLVAANFSVAVTVLLDLVERAARALPDYEVEIVEAHHRRKEDAPSGTALALGEAIAAARGTALAATRRDGRSGRTGARRAGEIGFHALRGGEVVGEHQVMLLGDADRLELVHRAADRSLFAAGALQAARWLVAREPGRYSMRQVVGLA